jgi:hypothetical protein
MKPQGKVFISYRREGGAELARLVRDGLRERGYNVFMDVEDLRSGLFNTELLQQIESSTDVVVILTPNSMEGCSRTDDWLRLEIEHAIRCHKNIVPVRARGFQWPSVPLPQNMSDLPNLQGVEPSHEYFSASIEKLTSLFVATPRSRFTRYVWAGIISAIAIVAALGMAYLATNLPLDRGPVDSSNDVQQDIREAIEAVELEENTVRFTGYEDRDSKGFLYMAYFGAPERIYYEDINSSQVWRAFFGFRKGWEVEPLLVFLTEPVNQEQDKCKALYLLKQSMLNLKDVARADTILAHISGCVEEGPAVRKAALSVFETSPSDPEVKWTYLSQQLKSVSDETYSSALRVGWKWIPPAEKTETCKNMLDIFSQTLNKWVACDLSYAMRKSGCTHLLPAMREELSHTLSSEKAWYLVRLIEDFEDGDAAPALRAAFSRHKNSTLYSLEIAEILFRIEGDSSLPFIIRTALYGSADLQTRIAESSLIGKPAMFRELRVIAQKGTAEERRIASEVIKRFEALESD